MPPPHSDLSTCLISAPLGADLGQLPHILDEAGIQWEWAKSEFGYAERWPTMLRRLIRRVDFVLGVILGGPGDINTMYEIGVAIGVGKPVLLILANEQTPPINLSAFPHVRASLTDEKPIALHLDLLVQSIEKGLRAPASPRIARWSEKHVAKSSALRRYRFERGTPESLLEADIANLILEVGGQVVLHPEFKEQSGKFIPDILFWLPTDDLELLNPAVLEIKSRPIASNEAAELQDRLVAFMQDAGIHAGIIVSRGHRPKELAGFRGSPVLNIFFFEINEFEALLRSGDLARRLRDERNRAAHGLR